MGDIAAAAGMSRPALYLLFCNKERIFQAVLARHACEVIEGLQRDLAGIADPEEKLRLAFQRWILEPYERMAESAEAQELFHCGFEFAAETLDRNYATFEALLLSILRDFPAPPDDPALPIERIAHLLSVSTRGLKTAAKNAQDLREMIETLVALTIAVLHPSR